MIAVKIVIPIVNQRLSFPTNVTSSGMFSSTVHPSLFVANDSNHLLFAFQTKSERTTLTHTQKHSQTQWVKWPFVFGRQHTIIKSMINVLRIKVYQFIVSESPFDFNYADQCGYLNKDVAKAEQIDTSSTFHRTTRRTPNRPQHQRLPADGHIWLQLTLGARSHR